MSDLVRTAVRREIAGDHDRQSGDSASSEVVTEVAEAIDRLENTVSDMDQSLETVRESVQSKESYSFEAAIRETLNKRPKGETVEGPNGPTELSSTESPADYGLTVSEIAARLDARESDVRDALRDLEQSGEIRSLNEYYFQRRGE